MDIVWHTASGCWEQTNCVELAAHERGVLMRSSKDPDGPVLRFTAPEWLAFLEGVRNHEFDIETLTQE